MRRRSTIATSRGTRTVAIYAKKMAKKLAKIIKEPYYQSKFLKVKNLYNHTIAAAVQFCSKAKMFTWILIPLVIAEIWLFKHNKQ